MTDRSCTRIVKTYTDLTKSVYRKEVITNDGSYEQNTSYQDYPGSSASVALVSAHKTVAIRHGLFFARIFRGNPMSPAVAVFHNH